MFKKKNENLKNIENNNLNEVDSLTSKVNYTKEELVVLRNEFKEEEKKYQEKIRNINKKRKEEIKILNEQYKIDINDRKKKDNVDYKLNLKYLSL